MHTIGKRAAALGLLALGVQLLGCAGMDIKTARGRTQEIAATVVDNVYRNQPVAALGGLPTEDGNLPRIVGAMKARFPEVAALLAEGTLGLSAAGTLALHDASALPAAQRKDVEELLRRENADRERLYADTRAAVGHAANPEFAHTVAAIFAEAWVRQAPAGWWVQDAGGQWARKP